MIAEMVSKNIEISNVGDALDLMANADHQGTRKIIIYEKNFHPDFFHLKTKMAGEILQKYSTYNIKLAIVGEFDKYQSNSLNAFIVECNRGSHIFFADNLNDAVQMLLGK